jgi:predicted Fe-S protein YdhL (DUF1289 family)
MMLLYYVTACRAWTCALLRFMASACQRGVSRASLTPLHLDLLSEKPATFWDRALVKEMNIPTMAIPSPCTGICKMDDASGVCLGCGRTGDEIAEWSLASDERRSAIWALLPRRFDSLGIAITRLPWPHGEIAEFVGRSLEQKSGIWTLGCYGAIAEFVCQHDEECCVTVAGETITARSPRGALRLTIGEQVRALQLRVGNGYGAIFLAVLKAKANLPVATTLTPLGLDECAIQPECRDQPWFDLGLGRDDLRFCIRSSSEELQDALNLVSGLPLSDVLQSVGATIITHGPARVVESPIGRAEIYTPVPPMDGQSPDGPHTHLLSGHLTTGRATPLGIDLPPVYALGATFYPSARSRGSIETECSAYLPMSDHVDGREESKRG